MWLHLAIASYIESIIDFCKYCMGIANSNAVRASISFMHTQTHIQFTDMHRHMTESSLIALNIAGISKAKESFTHRGTLDHLAQSIVNNSCTCSASTILNHLNVWIS